MGMISHCSILESIRHGLAARACWQSFQLAIVCIIDTLLRITSGVPQIAFEFIDGYQTFFVYSSSLYSTRHEGGLSE